MNRKVFRPLLKCVKQIEKTQTLESFVLRSTNWNEEHRMRMKEAYSSFAPEMKQVYQELSDLELADLVDFKIFVGEFDGKYG